MGKANYSLSEERKARFLASNQSTYDVVIVGGGVNGLGTAWDAALRGLKVLLVEKGDLGSGTSSWSSRMIHGGLKYLEKYDVPLVRESLKEREWLVKSAPHLIRELRFIIPFYKQNKNSATILRLGMIAYDILSFDKSLRRFEFFSREKILKKEPGLNTENLTGGCAYSDAQGVYSERMSYEIALAAKEAGAEILTHVKAIDLIVKEGKVESVKIQDELSGEIVEVKTKLVINNAGPWIDEVWPKEQVELPRMNGGTKGTHLVFDPFPGAPKDAFYYESRKDARPMMVIPWKGKYLIGSTDIPFVDDLDTASATQDEYDYILDETNTVLPGANLTKDKVIYAYTGVRPLPYSKGAEVSDITRRHKIVDHAPKYDGLYTLVGGKLTTFRQVGEDFGDILCKRLGVNVKCKTKKIKFPGGDISSMEKLREEIRKTGITKNLVERFADQYGTRALKLASFILEDPKRQVLLDEAFGLTAGEIEWAVTYEEAYRLSDVIARRVMIGLENDLGVGVLEPASKICAEVLGWDEERRLEEIALYKEYIKRLQVK